MASNNSLNTGGASTDLTNSSGLPETGVTFTDVTTNNASTSKHGFLKKLSNVSTEYMDGTGAWSTPAGGGSSGLTMLSVQTASASSSLAFTSLITSTYTAYQLVLQDIKLSTTTYLKLQVSFDNGSTWKTTNSYNFAGIYIAATGGGTVGSVTGYGGSNAADFAIMASTAIQSGADARMAGTINLIGPASATQFAASWDIMMLISGGYAQHIQAGGFFYDGTSPPVNAVRLIPNSGTITSGTATLYGLQKV